jgi:TRAP transporter TAXI family solute receptor
MRSVLRTATALTSALLVAAACAAPGTGQPGPASPTVAASPTGTAAASPTANYSGKPVLIVTGGQGGVYIVYGGGLANLLTNKLGVAATAQSTNASVTNMQLVRDKKADLAFTLADTAFDAVQGKAQFQTAAAPNLRTLTVLYNNVTQIVTKADSGITTVAGLKGKRVSVGAAASGTEVIANRVLEAAGLTQADLQVQKLGIADSATQLKDGRIDAFFWSGGLPTGAITDLAATTKIRIIDHSDLVAKMAEKYGAFYVTHTLPKDVYKLDVDAKVSAVPNLLVADASMEDGLVQAILRAMFDNQADLVAVHPEAKNLTHQNAVNGSPIDFHPGAIAYYKEKGVWNK